MIYRKAMMTNRVTVVKSAGCRPPPPSLMLSRQIQIGEHNDRTVQRDSPPDSRYIFNEYGQLTGHYVYADRIICEKVEGRVKVWLDQESFDAKDPERLICDYSEADLRGW